MNDILIEPGEGYEDNDFFDRTVIALGGDVKPDVRFYLEIIRSAAEEKDLDYFIGAEFKYHCFLIGLDAEFFTSIILEKKLILPKKKVDYPSRRPYLVRDDIIYKRTVLGISVKDLCEEYGMCQKTLRNLLTDDYKPFKAFSGKQEEIIKDYKDGMTVKALSVKYNTTSSSIGRALKGVPKRSRLTTKG